MRTSKTFKVVMLTTEKADAPIGMDLRGTLYDSTINLRPQHLYIISDEEIREGNYVISTYDNWKNNHPRLKPQLGKILEIAEDYYLIDAFDGDKNNKWNKGYSKKIVATTDKSFGEPQKWISAGGQGGQLSVQWNKWNKEAKFPQLLESFIKAYIKTYNEGKPITEVNLEIESETGLDINGNKKTTYNPRVRRDNTVIIHQSKTYSGEEVSRMIKVAYTHGYTDRDSDIGYGSNLSTSLKQIN